MLLRNVSPLGALDVPLLRAVVEAGEEFEVTGPVAAVLLQQTNFEPADHDARVVLGQILATTADDPAAARDSEPEPAAGAEENGAPGEGLEKLTNAELSAICAKRGLATSGTKAELITRIAVDQATPAPTPEPPPTTPAAAETRKRKATR